MHLRDAETELQRGDVAGLCRALAACYPDDPALAILPHAVRLALGESAARPNGHALSGDAVAEAFLASIAETREFWLVGDVQARIGRNVARRLVGRDFDFLGEWQAPPSWGALRALNHMLLNQITPTRQAAVVGTMRDDGIYALEWIAHYRALGFEHLIIYTNDNADGSEHLLRCLAGHGVIELVESETSGKVRPEVKAFEHACHLVHSLRDFAWVLFVDSDEYLHLAPRYSHCVRALLDGVEAMPDTERPSAILYEWLWFNSGMAFKRQPGLLTERFQHASDHWLTKTLVRLRDLESMRMQHVPILREGCRIVDSMFVPTDAERAQQRRTPQYGGGRINHYWPKSFEEFSLKKARGDTLHLSDPRYRTEYHQDFRRFFEWNAAETPQSRRPADTVFLDSVKQEMQRLRSLEGVAGFEAAVQGRFSELMRRYDHDGGLREIYIQLSEERLEQSLPVD